MAVAQLQVERTGRNQRATINHRGGLPLTKTLGRLIVVPGQDRVRHLLTPSFARSHARSAARITCVCETHVPGKPRRYWFAGQWLRSAALHFLGAVPRRSCGFDRRNRAAICGFDYQPYYLAR